MKLVIQAISVALIGNAVIILLLLAANASVFGPGYPPMNIASAVTAYMVCGVILSALVDIVFRMLEKSTSLRALQQNAADRK